MSDQGAMDSPPFLRLPDELIEAITYFLYPEDTISFSVVCRRSAKITQAHLVWQRHCVQTWRYWQPRHNLDEAMRLPPAQTRWKKLFLERQHSDSEAGQVFEEILLGQMDRIARIERLAKYGYDVKDLLLRLRDETNDDAEDVLARRYWANTVLGTIHRRTALEMWMKLQRREMVSLEEVLGAYDLFVLSGQRGDLGDIKKELNRLATAIKVRDDEWEDRSIRQKAVQVAEYLRAEQLVGKAEEQDYHALRNNFISLALFSDGHSSLPLQSVAIYCCVARRLGINAKPSNYPMHVHAIITAPTAIDLDNRPRILSSEGPADPASERETMHMDPWRSAEEIPHHDLTFRLRQMGVPPTHHAHHLGITTNMEMALRTGRNIMNSVQEARDRQGGMARRPHEVDTERAWYGMLWSMLALGDSNSATTIHRRRQCLPYLLEHFQQHFPEDVDLVERVLVPMFEDEREHRVLLELVTAARRGDRMARPIMQRTEEVRGKVNNCIGQYFEHKRYGYRGVVFGWSPKCDMSEIWIQQMRVDTLPQGRTQSFYNVLADDKSSRYVAEENIQVLTDDPPDTLMELAGKYFKRWDVEARVFVSNIRDEYPDD